MIYSIEITRKNVTVAEFLWYVKQQSQKKGLDCNIDRDEFEKPSREMNVSYHVKDGIKYVHRENGQTVQFDGTDAACKSEVCKSMPYDSQTYIKNFDGSFYNEICEFTFYDEKRGVGYYYQANKDA